MSNEEQCAPLETSMELLVARMESTKQNSAILWHCMNRQFSFTP